LKNIKFGLLLPIFLLVYANSPAQNFRFREKSISTIFEYSVISEFLPEGTVYQPFLPLLNFAFTVLKNPKKGNLFVYIEPQYNPVWIVDREREISDKKFEAGLNVGIRYEYKIWPKFRVFGGAGSGPHYISAETTLQSKGFIFSDNLFLGIKREIKNKFFVGLRYQFRHISNAGLKQPNEGIDNHFTVIEISKSFNK